MNTLTIDKTDPAVAEAVASCEVGKPETFTVTVTPQAVTDGLLVATVESITYAEETDEPETPEAAPAAPAKKPYKPRTSAPTALDVASE